MNWKEFNSKPRLPKIGELYIIDPKDKVTDNPTQKGSVNIIATIGEKRVVLSLWVSQAADICDFLDINDFKQPIKVMFHKEQDTNRRFPTLIEENL